MGVTSSLTEDDFRRLLDFRDGLRRFQRWSQEQARSAGITAAQHQLLLAIRGHGEAPSIRDVADHLLLRHHSVVELVDRAADGGLVERVADDADQRITRLQLTPEGMRRVELLAAAHLEELSRLRPTFDSLWLDLPPTP
ncbi:MarR family transcriptional regulator [soil metagenome]